MKVMDIATYSLRSWTGADNPFAVATLSGDSADGAQEMRAQPHRNTFYTIYWITSGEVKVTIDAVTYTVYGGALLFVAPGQVLQMVEAQPALGWWIGFDEQFYCIRDSAAARSKGVDSMLFFQPDFAVMLNPDLAEQASLEQILHMMADEINRKEGEYAAAIGSLLQLFLIRLSRILERVDKDPVQGDQTKPFLQFRQLIGEHHKETKNVSDYARMLNMSPVCLNALSKNISGLTAGEQIRNHIISEAKRLLHNTTLSAKEIAYTLGFEDAPYFSRFFKKYTGQTLLEFREQSRLNAV
jgi:AraC family transcriptional regulator, transcriptional activator of pobA